MTLLEVSYIYIVHDIKSSEIFSRTTPAYVSTYTLHEIGDFTKMLDKIPKWAINKNRNAQLILVCGALFSFLVALHQVGGRYFDILTPLSIYGDGLYHLMITKRMTSGTLYFEPALGFPFGSSMYDFPGSDSLSLAVLFVISKLTGSHAAAVNIYYLAGFPLATLSFSIVSRHLGISLLPAILGGILFSVLPFHFLRLNHLYLTWYFVIPIYIWYGWKIYNTRKVEIRSIKTFQWMILISGLVATASIGIYYAIFGMLAFLIAGVLGAIERKPQSLLLAVGACAVISVTILINTSPTLLYNIEHGKNTAVANRAPQEADIYGLKIAQLLLPQPVHRSEALRQVNIEYGRLFPLVTENVSSSLGLVAGIGFLSLLCYAIVGKRRGPYAAVPLRLLSVWCLLMVLLATIGGFGSLFSFFISPQIRAWNRISIFIACISLLASMIALTWLSARLGSNRLGKILQIIMLAGILCVGLWDQVGNRCDYGCAVSMQGHVNRQKFFFKKVQDALPLGSAIYVLPFMPFPETPPKNKLETYSLVEGYLYTEGLNWSYGSMKGRDKGDNFYETLEKKPIPEQLDTIDKLAFAGVIVDRRGYQDAGAEIEHDLLASGRVHLAFEQDFRSFWIIKR
jgi:phosphoglycerol transferase